MSNNSKVQCTYNFRLFGFYKCSIDRKTIPSNNFWLEGKHEESKSNNDVQWLDLTGCIMKEFPKGFQEMFPNITILHINNCEFDKIGREHLGKWKKLTQIIISNCGIKSLKGDTFDGLTRLSSINLSNNSLEEIDPNIFDGLTELKFINLSGNKNINMNALDPSQIQQLKKAIELKCKPKTNNNSPFTTKIQELEQEIQDLKVDKTKIYQILKEALENNDKLKRETTQFNKIKAIMTDPAFKDFTINIDDSSFKVHKLLFAARSETFAELFRNNPEATELNLRDIPEATFKAVHDFIYTNQLPEDDVNYLEVFSAANRLKIDDLVEITANQLLKTIDENNSIEILELSNKFNHQKLSEKAYENIRTKFFPDRKLDDKLAKNTEKIKKLIEIKKMFEEELETE